MTDVCQQTLAWPGAPVTLCAIVHQSDCWKMLRPAGLMPLSWHGTPTTLSAIVHQSYHWKTLHPASLVPLGWRVCHPYRNFL